MEGRQSQIHVQEIGYEKNKIHVINDTDKNLEPTNAD